MWSTPELTRGTLWSENAELVANTRPTGELGKQRKMLTTLETIPKSRKTKTRQTAKQRGAAWEEPTNGKIREIPKDLSHEKKKCDVRPLRARAETSIALGETRNAFREKSAGAAIPKFLRVHQNEQSHRCTRRSGESSLQDHG